MKKMNKRFALGALPVLLAKLMADTVSSFREPPFDIQVGAADAAGAAFQATLVGDGNMVLFQPVDIRRADGETGLVRTFLEAYRAVSNS